MPRRYFRKTAWVLCRDPYVLIIDYGTARAKTPPPIRRGRFLYSNKELVHPREREDVAAAAEVDENELISRRVRRDCEVVRLAIQDEFQECRTADCRKLDRLAPNINYRDLPARRGCGCGAL